MSGPGDRRNAGTPERRQASPSRALTPLRVEFNGPGPSEPAAEPESVQPAEKRGPVANGGPPQNLQSLMRSKQAFLARLRDKDLLADISQDDFAGLVLAIEANVVFEQGDTVFEIGHESEKVFFIEEGRADCRLLLAHRRRHRRCCCCARGQMCSRTLQTQGRQRS